MPGRPQNRSGAVVRERRHAPLRIALARALGALAAGLAMSAAVWALDARKPLGDFGVQAWIDELPQATVPAVYQTRDGYIWAGTFEGLVRFDGVSFTVFDLSVVAGTTSRGATALYEDREGSLWIGTNGGGLVRYRDGAFRRFDLADGLPDLFTPTLQEDRDGVLWVGTNRGLVRRVGERFALVDPFPGGGGPPALRVRALATDREGTLWIATQVGLLRRRDGRFERFTAKDGLASDDVRAVAVDGSGNVYAGTEGGGLSIDSGGRVQTLTERDGLAGNAVRALVVDRQGALWIGTEGGGISRLWHGALETLDAARGLPSNLIRGFAEDHEGSMWVATNGGGLAVLRDQKFTTYGPEHGLAQPNVRVVLEDRTGALWIGTDGGGLVRMDKSGARAFTVRDGLPNDYVRSLLEARDGSLWVGTNAGGVARLRDGRLEAIDPQHRVIANSVSAFAEGRDGTLWIGTGEVGLYRLRPDAPGALPVRVPLPPEAGDVKALYEDRDGTLWVGTTGVVCKVTGGTVSVLAQPDGERSGQGFAFFEDPDGSLWIGTDRGLLRLHEGRMQRFDRRQGLPDDVVFRILDDGRGNLWLTSNHGIGRVSRESLLRVEQGKAERVEAVLYTRGDGLRSHQCNGASQPAGWRTRDGRLLIPTNRGLSVIDPGRLVLNDKVPPVTIERVLVDGKPVAAGGDGPRLAPGVERLEIQYTALSFLAPERVQFRYKLEGYDRDWIDAGTRRVAYYTRIGPGDFRFRVQAANNDGVWNETGAALALAVEPHLWELRWFQGLLGLALVVLAFLAARARVRGLERRAGKLETVVAERTRQLQEANQRLEDLSFLDGLTGIPNRRRFDEALLAEWRRAARSGEPLTVLVMDVDFFKQYNDSLGHPAGDECLVRIARVLSEQVHRPGDLAARLGGEEFAFIAASTDAAGAGVVAERLRRTVEQLHLPHPRSAVSRHVTMSIGFATTQPSFAGDASRLLAAADRALYAAKQAGRNRAESVELPSPAAGEGAESEERIM